MQRDAGCGEMWNRDAERHRTLRDAEQRHWTRRDVGRSIVSGSQYAEQEQFGCQAELWRLPKMSQGTGKLLMVFLILPAVLALVTKIELRRNLWVTWANHTGISEFCLSMASSTDPFRTCLIGIPVYDPSEFGQYDTNNCHSASSVAVCSAKLINSLAVPLPWDPQELQLLGLKGSETDHRIGLKHVLCLEIYSKDQVLSKNIIQQGGQM